MYRPISELPKNLGLKMFVAISIRPEYVSDPWCVWFQPNNPTDENNHGFVRWPHKDFAPTHFLLLPEVK